AVLVAVKTTVPAGAVFVEMSKAHSRIPTVTCVVAATSVRLRAAEYPASAVPPAARMRATASPSRRTATSVSFVGSAGPVCPRCENRTLRAARSPGLYETHATPYACRDLPSRFVLSQACRTAVAAAVLAAVALGASACSGEHNAAGSSFQPVQPGVLTVATAFLPAPGFWQGRPPTSGFEAGPGSAPAGRLRLPRVPGG